MQFRVPDWIQWLIVLAATAATMYGGHRFIEWLQYRELLDEAACKLQNCWWW